MTEMGENIMTMVGSLLFEEPTVEEAIQLLWDIQSILSFLQSTNITKRWNLGEIGNGMMLLSIDPIN